MYPSLMTRTSRWLSARNWAMLRLLSISNVGMSVWCILFFGYDIHASGAFVGVSIGLVALSISLFGVLGLILTLFRSFRDPSRLKQKSWGLAAMTLLMVVVGLLGFLSPVPLKTCQQGRGPTASQALSTPAFCFGQPCGDRPNLRKQRPEKQSFPLDRPIETFRNREVRSQEASRW